MATHGKGGRPRKDPPAGAEEKVRTLSAEGHSQVGIAEQFSIDVTTLVRWFEDFPAIKEAFDQGREKERHTLHNSLYVAATKGNNPSAAMFLLKARHGYREGDQGEQGNKVSITFNLPGAMPLENFISGTAVEVKPQPVGSPAKTLERK